MLVDIVLTALAFYLSIPLVAGYFAHSYGRSFWLWFSIGAFLPVVTHLVLVILVYFDERRTAPNRLTKRECAIAERLVRELMEEVHRTEVKNKQ